MLGDAMNRITFQIPPFPIFVKAGKGTFQKGKKHFRRTFEVIDCLYVRKGKLYMQEEDQQYEVAEGEYLVLAPHREHFGYEPCKEETEVYWFHFAAEFSFRNAVQLQWTDVLQKEGTFTEPASFLLQIPQYGRVQNKELAERMLEMLTEMEGAVSIEERLKQPLHFYQVLIFLQKEALAIPSAAEKVCEQTVAYIQRYYNRQLKITDIAQDLHYHEDYLTRCMQKTMGVGPLQYLNEVRLQKAKQLLAATTEKVKTISQQVGIQDEMYFSRLFRKQEGISPQEYRRMMQRIL